jgi:hypothetical protein
MRLIYAHILVLVSPNAASSSPNTPIQKERLSNYLSSCFEYNVVLPEDIRQFVDNPIIQFKEREITKLLDKNTLGVAPDPENCQNLKVKMRGILLKAIGADPDRVLAAISRGMSPELTKWVHNHLLGLNFENLQRIAEEFQQKFPQYL